MISLLIKTNFPRFALRMESHSESLKIYESADIFPENVLDFGRKSILHIVSMIKKVQKGSLFYGKFLL